MQKFEQHVLKEPVAIIPENFKVDEYYNSVPLLGKDAKKTRDAFYFILTSVCSGSYLPGFNPITRFQEPKAVSTALLKKVLGNEYKAYLDTLLNNEVIELVKQNSSGSARKYILGPRFCNQPVKCRHFLHPHVKNQIKKTTREFYNRKRKVFLTYAPLIYWTWDKRLYLDEKAAKAYYTTFLNKCLDHAKRTL